MEKIRYIICVIFLFAPLGKTDYVAAVVEHQPVRSEYTMRDNIACYCSDISEAYFQHHAKIIVFPEYGLTGMVEDPTVYALEVPEVGVTVTLGEKYQLLFSLAKTARIGIYVVVNLLERAQNSRNETVFYNTNVVFDPSATVVAKYRKVNLYNESKLTPGDPSENQAIFETNFGVTFGMFIGFDMLSYNPSRSILMNSSVTDILLPTAWFSTLPFFHSLSFHSGYAMANKVNLLVATNHDFQNGIGGSGIYGSDGTVYSYYISERVETHNGMTLFSTVGDLKNDTNTGESQVTQEHIIKPVSFQARRYFDSDHYSFKDISEAYFQHHAKIIVFPEYGLTGMVEDPTVYALEVPEVGVTVTLGEKYQLLFSLAKTARIGIYVVVNLLERAQNSRNETVFYNTNVVFDPSATVVAKYRKVNLYNESKLTPGDPSENQAIFETNFGVTFGMFIGFDMLSYNPSRSILMNSSVTDILLPTAWFSTLPFFHSLSFHSGYAMANKVNLLVATNHDFQNGIGGSGIYGSDGTVYSYYISERVETHNGMTLFSTVGDLKNDTNTGESQVTQEHIIKPVSFQARRYFDSDHYSFKDLNLTREKISEEICDGSFCCSFNIVLSPDDVNTSEIYKLMAQHGQYRMGEYKQNNVKICSLLACQNSSSFTCGLANVSISSQFKSITVKTNVEDASKDFYQPISLTTDLLPVFNTSYSSTVANGTRSIVFSTTDKVEEKVLVFGIYGNSGITVGASFTLLVVVMAAKYLF